MHSYTRRPTGRPILLVAAVVALLGSSNLLAERPVFDWPAPAQAQITVEQEKAGRTFATEMQLDVSRVADSTQWRMDFADVRLLRINEQDVTSPEERSEVPASFLAMTEAEPSFIVDENGYLVDVPGVEGLLDEIIEQMPERPPEVTRDGLRLVLFDPAMIDLIAAKADRHWHLWVGLWLDKDFEPGRRLEFDAESDYFGITVPSRGYFELLGEVDERPGVSRLVFELVSRDDALRDAVVQSLKAATEQAQQAGEPEPQLAYDAIKAAERRERVTVLTELATMRPHEVQASTRITLDIEGHGVHTQSEEHLYRFDWRQ